MTSTITNTQTSQPTTSKVSYASVTQQVQVPTKEQAIIFDAIEGISVQEYARAMGKIISPINIRFISRISHGRVCLYLSDKEIADRLINTSTKINIGNQELQVRPLVSRAKRIILSNACPIISNELIINELKNHNIIPTSKITYIRAGMNDAGFAHLLSFRRQMYIKPEDIPLLPPVLRIQLDNTTYYIYLSTEKVTCFLCNEEGHLAKHCKNIQTPTQNQTDQCDTNTSFNTAIVPNSLNETPNAEPFIINNETMQENSESQMLPPNNNKRPLSSSTSTRSSMQTPNDSSNTHYKKGLKITQPIKKTKKSPETSLEEIADRLSPAKDFVTLHETTLPLSFEQITEFLYNTYGKQNIPEIANKVTNDYNSLIKMLSDINDLIVDNNLKHRIVRIKKRLENADHDENSSISSQSDCQEI